MSSPDSSPKKRSSRWFKRGLIAFLVLANLAVFGVYWRLRSIEQVVQNTAATIPDVEPVLTPTTPEENDPSTFLVIGSDSREGLDDLTNFGEAGGQRADVIMLVQIHPDSDRAQILSIPRDLWVEIPGQGENRINAAYQYGGAPLMVETVMEVTGLPVHHYVEVDFLGFQEIVDELGGVVIDFPYPARDVKSGLQVDAGPQRLDGEQALAYARSRSYQELRNGSWVAVDANDFGRTERQQTLIFAILREMARPSSLAEAGSVVEAFASHLSMDPALAEASLVRLAFEMRGVSADSIEAATLPGNGTTINGAAVLLPDEPAFSQLIAAFGAGEALAPTLEGPADLAVLNGNGISGSAGRWSEHLEEEGFNIARIGDAEAKDFEQTLVLVRPGEVEIGEQVVEALGFGLVEVRNIDNELDAIVILGRDAGRVTADGLSGG